MIVVFETESGRLITDEIYVRTGVAYEVRTEVVGEHGSAFIGLDQNLQVKRTDGRWGGQLTPSFVERFGAAYDTELQRWVDAARAGTIDGPGAWDGYAAVAVCEAGVAGRTQRREGGRGNATAPLSLPKGSLSKVMVRRASPSRPVTSPPPIWKRPGHEARARRADVLRDQHGLGAARHRGRPRLRLDGAVAQGRLHPVLQVPPGRRRRGAQAEEGGVRRRRGIASLLPVLRWSGPDEDQRQAAVRAWKRSIQIAVDLGRGRDEQRVQRPAGGGRSTPRPSS